MLPIPAAHLPPRGHHPSGARRDRIGHNQGGLRARTDGSGRRSPPDMPMPDRQYDDATARDALAPGCPAPDAAKTQIVQKLQQVLHNQHEDNKATATLGHLATRLDKQETTTATLAQRLQHHEHTLREANTRHEQRFATMAEGAGTADGHDRKGERGNLLAKIRALGAQLNAHAEARHERRRMNRRGQRPRSTWPRHRRHRQRRHQQTSRCSSQG